MKRMRARIGSFADFSLADTDDGVPAADIAHDYLRSNGVGGIGWRVWPITSSTR
jgi:hypothetical protein